jgi:hypothetical protein
LEGGITFNKLNDNDIVVTFGGKPQHFKNLASARRYLANSIYNSDLRKNDITKTAEILRSLK